MKKKLTILIISIILVLLVLSTTTYALFFKQDKLENESTYTAGILDIVLENDEEGLGEVLNLADAFPISDEEGKQSKPYKFKITNKGNLTYTFDLKLLSTTTENQIDSQYIKVMIDDNEPVYLSSLASSIIANNLTLNPGQSKMMSVRLWLDEYTPNTEIGKAFSAKIVGDGKASEVSASYQTLIKLGLTAKEETPDFSKTATTDEGIYSAEDDYGTSYYFRGAVENNYVKYAGLYWRIVRINGNGSIRLIYDGISAHANGESNADRHTKTSVYNTVANDNTYVGYMYGKAGANNYLKTHSNNYDSNVKIYLDNWYDTIISPYDDVIEKDTIFCNDRSIASTQPTGYNTNGYGINKTVYRWHYGPWDTNQPTLKCPQLSQDGMSVTDASIGNKKLTSPIGMITMDEASMAGGINAANTNYYLYTGQKYWTMSARRFDGTNADIRYVNSNGGLGGSDNVTVSHYIKPVISIKSSATITGNGTIDNPFLVEVEKKSTPTSQEVLTKLGLTAKKGKPDFSVTATTNQGIYSATDDYGKSYYFRGASTKNYVKFANKWWRIIRINGNGTIRMIYDGTIAHDNGESSTDRQIETSVFNGYYYYNAYVGYMYGTPGSSKYAAEHKNTNNSTIKDVVDSWYKTNIEDKGFGEKVADVIYCNDRNLDTTQSGDGATDNETDYGADYRLFDNQLPILTCSQKKDAFTVADEINGNGALNNPVGLITADEVSMAGGVYTTSNSNYYLYTGDEYWTMSPFYFDGSNAHEFYVHFDGSLSGNKVNDERSVRPVLSLKSTLEFKGTGTMTDPFIPQ